MNIDNLLSVCSPAVANIFEHLSARDLSSCAQVCKMWYDISVPEFKRRKHIDWFLEEGQGSCRFNELPDGQYSFQRQIRNSRLQPSFCLALLSEDAVINFDDRFRHLLENGLYQRTRCTPHGRIPSSLPIVDPRFLKPYLPPSCDFHWFTSVNIVSCYNDLPPDDWLRGGANMSGILLSKCPGVEIHHLTIKKPTSRHHGIPEPPKGTIKCMFIIGDYQDLARKFVERCALSQKENFALAGGLVNKVHRGRGSAFAFTGDNVQGATVIITKSMAGEAVANELKLFQKTGLLENECFCIVFACEGRSETGNQESILFRQMYPNVPLVGIYVDEAIGTVYLPNAVSQRPKMYGYEDSSRGFSSVYLLVSIKKQK